MADWGGSGGGSSGVRQLIVLGVSIGISLCFLLAAGIRYAQWLPMLNLAFVILAPVAVILTESMGRSTSWDTYSEKKVAFTNFGTCFFGVILVSIFGLPCVLYHTNAVTMEPFALWMASTVVIFVASVYYWIARAAARSS